MDIENRSENLINYNLNDLLNYNLKEDDMEHFTLCPRAFYSGLSEREIISMQQLYTRAYTKAEEQIQNKYNHFYDGGSGI